ncbi:MAG: (Fe-S)-binding protein [Bacteroidetes bacterium]|nr:(Fe-S)-binding protein [Bacteroidota bacterium]MBK7971666.1 (Fe-S)-binding protein [Bacteroidota bacterium]MBK8415361.1 (Fe-S)-binding protein [Bacteroidota bacterium]MBK9424233.1 (Fe-S)-binding protein [Bacteroidota bacterium]
MIVDIFIPCYIDQFYPDTAMNMVKVLEKVGCGVNYNPEQTCCGLPAFHEGYRDHCKEVGEKLIHEFQNDRYIVSPGASCVSMVKNYYPEMFHNSSLHNEYKQMQKYFFELSDFLVNIMHVSDVGAKLNTKATFLDNCTAMRECGIHESPRLLLSKVKGLKLVEMRTSDTETCCGWGGVFASRFEEIAVKLAEKKVEQILKTGAEVAISTDMGCLMHLEGYINKNNIPLKVMHLADVLSEGYDLV